MSRRAIYHETTNSTVTVSEFQTIAQAVENWHNGNTQLATEVSLNPSSMRVTVKIMLTGRGNAQLESALTQLDQAAQNLVGDWPAPSDNARFVNE